MSKNLESRLESIAGASGHRVECAALMARGKRQPRGNRKGLPYRDCPKGIVFVEALKIYRKPGDKLEKKAAIQALLKHEYAAGPSSPAKKENSIAAWADDIFFFIDASAIDPAIAQEARAWAKEYQTAFPDSFK